MKINEINKMLEKGSNKSELFVYVENIYDETIVKLNCIGYVDTYNSKNFEELVSSIINLGFKSIILDLSKLSYMSSTGIGVLVTILKKIQNLNGSLYLYQLQPNTKEVISILGFTSFFNIIDSLDNLNLGIQTYFPKIVNCPHCLRLYKVNNVGSYTCLSCKGFFGVL